jgi:hypothetical protein
MSAPSTLTMSGLASPEIDTTPTTETTSGAIELVGTNLSESAPSPPITPESMGANINSQAATMCTPPTTPSDTSLSLRRSVRSRKTPTRLGVVPDISEVDNTPTKSRPKKITNPKNVPVKAVPLEAKSPVKTRSSARSKAKAVPAKAVSSKVTKPITSRQVTKEKTVDCPPNLNDVDVSDEPPPKRAKSTVALGELETLKQISDTLRHQNAHSEMSTKPDPIGEPPVWASSRQALCETLHYYRAYQGGCYSIEKLVRAFMFDKAALDRDYMDSDVIVSRGGGGMSRNEDGEMVLSKDRGESAQIIALRNNIAHSNPVVVILSDQCPTSPSKMPRMYNVLGWYKPTDVWYEKYDDKKLVRFRLEKLCPNEPGWWTPKDVIAPISLGELSSPVEQACNECGKVSVQRYLNGWMCLIPECVKFWKYSNTMEPDESSLRYDPRWLKKFTPWLYSNDPEPVRPAPFVPVDGDHVTASMSRRACRGRVCDHCGACILRVKWQSWECCGEGGCGRSYPLPPSATLVPLSKLEDANFPKSTKGLPISRAAVDSLNVVVTEIQNDIGGYKIMRYDVPGTNSYVLHLTAGLYPTQEPGGANDMWKTLQESPPDLIRQQMDMSFGKEKDDRPYPSIL